MRKLTTYLLLLAGLLVAMKTQAQFNPDNIVRIEEGKIIIVLNKNWSDKDKAEVTSLFDIDSLVIARALQGVPEINFEGEQWKVKKISNAVIEISKTIDNETSIDLNTVDLFSVLDLWSNFAGDIIEESVTVGVNDFENANTFAYSSNNAWFYLAGYTSASKVYIAGTFNDWSTGSTPMKAGPTGWTVSLNLKPGKYAYKFIVDGRWIHDPMNKLRERDGAGGYNSIVYCYNHVFQLKGYPNAQKVVVTGNFNNWDPRKFRMNKTPQGWTLPLYLKDGSYAYKFLVDNQWMTDPENKDIRKDNSGNNNSFLGIGEPFLFKLNGYTQAQKVVLTGSFNGWNEGELLMNKTSAGWELNYVIAPGNYEYKFIADGRWLIDPGNPFSTGKDNYENSFIALKANHLFELAGYPQAKEVIVTGSFNGWNTENYRMHRQGGKWIFPIFLKPGKYTYKFIVDRNWMIDPANKLFEDNSTHTNNSVLWIEP